MDNLRIYYLNRLCDSHRFTHKGLKWVWILYLRWVTFKANQTAELLCLAILRPRGVGFVYLCVQYFPCLTAVQRGAFKMICQFGFLHSKSTREKWRGKSKWKFFTRLSLNDRLHNTNRERINTHRNECGLLSPAFRMVLNRQGEMILLYHGFWNSHVVLIF